MLLELACFLDLNKVYLPTYRVYVGIRYPKETLIIRLCMSRILHPTNSPDITITDAVSVKQGLRTADCGLRTADCGLRTADCGRGIKRGLRAGCKTWTAG